MAFLELIAAVYAILALVYIATLFKRPANFPPGPRWIPFFGNSIQLKKLSELHGGQYFALLQWARDFKSNVVGFKLGGSYVISVVSYPLCKEVLTTEAYEYRPDNFFLKLRCLGKIRGVTCTNGDFWMEQRNFISKHMRTLGYGKIVMDNMIRDEIQEVLREFKTNNREVELEPIFAPAVMNILWTMATGKRFPKNDVRLSDFLALLYKRSKAFDMAGGILGQMPWLRFIAPEKSGYNLLVKLNTDMKKFLMETIQEHYATWKPNRSDDLIYAFISEMKRNENGNTTFTEDQLIVVCLDLFIAGSNTTSNTLDFIFLSMVLHPEIQEKVANELNNVIHSNEPIEYADRLKVPYVEAVLMEVERYFCPVPTIGPRCTSKTTTLDGFTIPKGATVLLSFYSFFHDPEYWGDPQVFRPERFLDDQGQLVTHDRFIYFGLGRRRCLGDLLARHSIFMFFAEIIRKYKVSEVPGTAKPSEVTLPGILLSPQKYKVRLTERQNN